MNKKDFYKQLMSEYSFDAEEIRKNARKGKQTGRKLSPMYIGMAAAAAAVTVAAGTAVFSIAGRNTGVSLVQGDTLAAYSDAQRVENAMREIQQNEGSSELKDMLITFTVPSSPEAVSSILTSHAGGSVNIKMLCFADGTRAVGSEQVGSALESGKMISGAVINCEGALMASLNSDPEIYLVEIITDSDDISVVSPVNVNGTETTVTPPVTTVPIDNISIPADEEDDSTDGMDGTEVATDESDDFESEETIIDDPETIEPDDNSSTDNSEPDIPDTSDSNSNTSDTTDVPVTPVTPVENPSASDKLPDGVTLPETANTLNFNTYIDAETAFFLTDDIFYVKTANTISLYRFNGTDDAILVAQEECSEAKNCYVAENGSRMLVSGVVDGKRSKLFLVDAVGEFIVDLGTEETVMDGSLSGVGFNDVTNTLYLNVKDSGTYYVYSMRLENNSLEFIGSCFESSAKTSLMASEGNNLYLAAIDGSLTQIFRVSSDGSAKDVIAAYENNPKFSSNLAFTHAMLSPSDSDVSMLFDPATESFISLGGTPSNISFGASRHSFNADGSLYTISGGKLTPAAGISVTSKIEYRKSLSALYTATVSYGCVKITPAAYTSSVMSGQVTFSDVTDSAPDDIRAALNGAIGVNNVLAQDAAQSAGITTPGVLIQCISAYYSDSAEAALLKQCGISEYGSLNYGSGGLSGISVSDTVLTISGRNETTAQGVLYIRAGTFCGRTAYTTRNVEFVKENGSWKLNTVL